MDRCNVSADPRVRITSVLGTVHSDPPGHPCAVGTYIVSALLRGRCADGAIGDAVPPLTLSALFRDARTFRAPYAFRYLSDAWNR